MKIKINRNILWTEAFVNELAFLGVKYVCISPGSRNTSLTLAFSSNKKIKSFVHIDERSSGFFALGMAKASNTPVAVVCTSGTAAAELYPSIIEAYQNKVPLIICTADRPPELIGVGTNQTIYQNEIYKNHIRWFANTGTPVPNKNGLKRIKNLAHKAIEESFINNRGPVHLNFPFRKPFEPSSMTDEIDKKTLTYSKKNLTKSFSKKIISKNHKKRISIIIESIKENKNGLIIVGPKNYDKNFNELCIKLSDITGYPILADGSSQLRFGNKISKNIISNFESIFKSKDFLKQHKAKIILQFGRTVTSKALEDYLESYRGLKFLINDYGDLYDPADKTTDLLAMDPNEFCKEVISNIKKKKIENQNWLNDFIQAERDVEKLKLKQILNSKFPNEPRIITELIKAIPQNSHIMISNSMPVRDFDYFAPIDYKKLVIHNNRGASGIDGIISTALGIAVENKNPVFLITGDLAFYHDLNGLLAAKKYNIPLTVILINNNGGGIFRMLPVSTIANNFVQFFQTPHDLDFSKFVKAYGGNHFKIKSWSDFNLKIEQSLPSKKFTVLEIKTNAESSHNLRRNFWTKASDIISG